MATHWDEESQLRARLHDELTYPEVGGTTADRLPPGYQHVRYRRLLGVGSSRFEDASRSLMTWQVHRRAGLHVTSSSPVAQQGAVVLMRLGWGRAGLLIPCRVVHVWDEPRRRGFAYGTLPGHPECGEEAFVVEQHEDGSVWFAITAFSRQARWFSRAGAPLSRVAQSWMTRRYLDALAEPPGGGTA